MLMFFSETNDALLARSARVSIMQARADLRAGRVLFSRATDTLSELIVLDGGILCI